MALLVSQVSLQHWFSWLRSKVSRTIQASGVSSAEAEHRSTKALAKEVIDILTSYSEVILKDIKLQE